MTTTRCQYSWCIYLARAVPKAIGGWYLLEWDGAVGSYKYLSWRRVLHQPGMAASIFEDGTHTVSLPELSRRWTKGGRGEKLRKKKLRKRGWRKNGQRVKEFSRDVTGALKTSCGQQWAGFFLSCTQYFSPLCFPCPCPTRAEAGVIANGKAATTITTTIRTNK